MDKKEQILHYYRVDGLSLREISRRVGLNRKTVTLYVREFEKMSLQDDAHYDTMLETCRVRKPRDKGAVEGLVRKVYNAVYAELHDETFHSIESMNERISGLMDAFNSKPSRTTGRSRMDIFESEEKSSLGELPRTPFRFRYRKEVKLTGSYHIQIGLHKYSVPYQYVGQQVVVVWDVDTVEIYVGEKRVASHNRKMTNGHTTTDGHMPPEHLAYRHGQGYNAAYFLEEAEDNGPYTKTAVESILKKNRHVEQSYGSCHGIMTLKRTYGRERLEKACRRLHECPSVTYTMIKNVLVKNLDKVENMETASHIPFNDDVRGAEVFNKIMEAK